MTKSVFRSKNARVWAWYFIEYQKMRWQDSVAILLRFSARPLAELPVSTFIINISAVLGSTSLYKGNLPQSHRESRSV